MEDQKKGEVVDVRGGMRFNRMNVRHRLSRRSRRIVLFSLAIVFVGLVAAGYFALFKSPALIVGGQRISRDQYSSLLKQAELSQINAEGAKETIIESIKYQQAAKKFDIKINQDDLKRLEENSTLPATFKDDIYYYGLKKSYILLQLEIKKRDGFEGYVFYYPFSRNFLDSDPKTSNPLFKNKDAIESDRQKAEERALADLQGIKSGKSNPDDLVKEILNDSSLIYGNASNGTQRFAVDNRGVELSDGYGAGKVVASRFMDILPKMKEGSVSDIRKDVQKYLEAQSNKIVSNNTAYYFVYKTKNIIGDKDIVDKFNKEVSGIKVVDNVK